MTRIEHETMGMLRTFRLQARKARKARYASAASKAELHRAITIAGQTSLGVPKLPWSWSNSAAAIRLARSDGTGLAPVVPPPTGKGLLAAISVGQATGQL